MKTLKSQFAKLVKSVLTEFSNLKGSKFVGIKEYYSSTSGEIANHVVIANFSYKKAVKKDLKALQTITDEQKQAIAKKGFSIEMIEQAIEKMKTSFINNLNPETQSNQSKAQQDAYLNITNGIKLHIETGKLFMYALTVPESKQIIQEGEHKKVNSRPLTLCQNEIKKVLNFSTAKFRQFSISPDQLTGVNISGEKFVLR